MTDWLSHPRTQNNLGPPCQNSQKLSLPWITDTLICQLKVRFKKEIACPWLWWIRLCSGCLREVERSFWLIEDVRKSCWDKYLKSKQLLNLFWVIGIKCPGRFYLQRLWMSIIYLDWKQNKKKQHQQQQQKKEEVIMYFKPRNNRNPLLLATSLLFITAWQCNTESLWQTGEAV